MQEARWGYEYQQQITEKFGRVLGCPLFSLGAEVGTREESLIDKIKQILDQHLRYYESALREAQDQQLIAMTPVAPIAFPTSPKSNKASWRCSTSSPANELDLFLPSLFTN
ncbi:MAG: hypothetical protein EAZ81_03555 [Verrucomicrobia bacterium]|nr:MAG: hypothetical protein EAZ81_03555 [Verrucomicrobiota bacterium]